MRVAVFLMIDIATFTTGQSAMESLLGEWHAKLQNEKPVYTTVYYSLYDLLSAN